MHNFRSNPDDPCPGDPVLLLNVDGSVRYETRVRTLESVDYDLAMFEILTTTGDSVVVTADAEADRWIQVLSQ